MVNRELKFEWIGSTITNLTTARLSSRVPPAPAVAAPHIAKIVKLRVVHYVTAGSPCYGKRNLKDPSHYSTGYHVHTTTPIAQVSHLSMCATKLVYGETKPL